MTTYYSILYATIRPDISERLSVALLFVSEEKIYLKTSQHKLNILKTLFPAGPYNSLKNSIKSIESMLKIHDSTNTKNTSFGFNKKQETREFSLSYIDYLSNYNNNILTFSSPKLIDLTLDENIFNLFYSKFIDDIIEKKDVQKSFSLFKNDFTSKVKNYFNIDQKITAKEIPNLLAPLKFDLIGKNEIEVFAQFIDIEKQTYLISNEINTMYSIQNVIPKSKRFIVSTEPNKFNFPEQHALWEKIQKTDLFDYIHQDEVEKIKKYAEEHQVKPLVSETENTEI